MKKKIEKTFDEFVTKQDLQQAVQVQIMFDSNFCKKSDAYRLMETIVTFDGLSTANIYHLQLTYRFDGYHDAISCFTKSIKGLSEFWLICSVGDFCTRFIAVSYLSPVVFQKLLTRNFNRLKTESLFNIIF